MNPIRFLLSLIIGLFALGAIPAFALTNQVNASAYCAFDGVQITGQITLSQGSPNLTVTGGSFTAADAGKAINIAGGGGGSTPFVTTILSDVSATQVVLSANAPVSISGSSAIVSYGSESTTCLNQFFSYVTANNAYGIMPTGTALFTGQLSIPPANNWSVLGSGSNQSLLLYAGANASTELMTIGDGVTPPSYVNFGKFRIDSATPMTSGAAIHVHMISFSKFTDLEAGLFTFTPNGPRYLRDGLWFDQVQWTILDGFKSQLLGDALIADGGATNINGELSLDNIQIAYCGGKGIHIGGGLGGIYFKYVSVAACQYALFVDQSITNVQNREMFIGPHTAFDSSAQDNIYINQNGEGILTFLGWSCGALGSVGKGISIAKFPNGIVSIGGGMIFGNKGDGIYVGDPTAKVHISAGVSLDYNGGYGVSGTNTNGVFSDANPIGNSVGRYAPAINVENLNPAYGFRKNGNGEIHQWGTVAGSNNDTTIVFPIPFPTGVTKITPTIFPAVNSATIMENVSILAESLQGFTGSPRYVANGGTVGHAGEQWQWDAWGQ